MPFRLLTLGTCRLEDHEGRNVPVSSAAVVMLAYLSDRGAPVSRHELATLLWPAANHVAQTNLRSMLRRFVTACGDRDDLPLIIGREDLELHPAMLHWDLDHLDQGTDSERLKALSDAMSRGFLIKETARPGRLGQWISQTRLRLSEMLKQALLACHVSAERGTSPADIRRAALILLDAEPDDEVVRSVLESSIRTAEPVASPVPGLSCTVSEPLAFGTAASLIRSGPSTIVSGLEDRLLAGSAARTKVSGHIKVSSPVVASLPRLALLPPETQEGSYANHQVANALIEDLTIGLCASRSVRVVAPYTAQKFRASNDKAALLRRHEVHYALDTRRSGDWLFAQLVFLPADDVVWATRFKLDAMQTLQQRSVIAEAIQTSIIERMQGNDAPFENFKAGPEAYFAYLSGLHELSEVSLPALRRARKQFRSSVAHDRDFAPALAGLSRTLTLEWVLTAQGDDALLAEAERLARQAIETDSLSALAFKELGVSQLYRGRIDDSLAALQEAERLSPHYAEAIYSHGDSLTHASRPGLAIEKLKQAISLNPIAPDVYLWAAAGACYFLEDYAQALSYVDRMQDKKPATRLAAACCAMLGDLKRARLHRLRFLKDNPSFDLDNWLAMVPHKEQWQTELYREGLVRAGFKSK
jgi:tetratricopeptide (TPR) repeat protein